MAAAWPSLAAGGRTAATTPPVNRGKGKPPDGLGRGSGSRPSLGRGGSGGEAGLFPLFFSFSLPGFCFLFSLYLLIPFSVLFHLKHLGIL